MIQLMFSHVAAAAANHAKANVKIEETFLTVI